MPAYGFIRCLHTTQRLSRDNNAAGVAVKPVAECGRKSVLPFWSILPLFVQIIQNLVDKRIPVGAFFRMAQKPRRLGNHKDIIILIDDAEMSFCRSKRFFLCKGIYRFLRKVKLQRISGAEQLTALRPAAVQLNTLFPQHFIQKTL